MRVIRTKLHGYPLRYQDIHKTVTQTAMLLHNVIKYKGHGVLGNLNEISVMCQDLFEKFLILSSQYQPNNNQTIL